MRWWAKRTVRRPHYGRTVQLPDATHYVVQDRRLGHTYVCGLSVELLGIEHGDDVHFLGSDTWAVPELAFRRAVSRVGGTLSPARRLEPGVRIEPAAIVARDMDSEV